MKRLMQIAAVALVLALIAGTTWAVRSALVSAEPGQRVVTRQAPPACEEIIAALGLEGQEVHCQDPASPSGDAPVVHGGYRLIPSGYVGTLTYQNTMPADPPQGVVTDDMEVLMGSSLYKAPSYMPEGYELSSMDTRDSHSENIIHAVYTGPGNPIEVNRIRRYEAPLDVSLGGADSLLVVEEATLGDTPAIFSYPRPGSPLEGIGLTYVRFLDGSIETVVKGDGLDLPTAVAIAESLR
jgi:hypothetical protein